MKKVVVLAGAALAAVSLTGCALLYPNWGTDQDPSDSATPTTSATPTVTPTETPTPSESPSKQKQVAEFNFIDVTTDSSGVFAVVEVINVAEDGGTCTFVLSDGTHEKSVTVSAEPNVTTTQCFPANISRDGLSGDSATLTVRYQSSSYDGSASMKVDLP